MSDRTSSIASERPKFCRKTLPSAFLIALIRVMCWVAIDRGLRLADKRSLPAPNRNHWIETRDKIFEEVQERGWNKKAKFFAQVRPSVHLSHNLTVPKGS